MQGPTVQTWTQAASKARCPPNRVWAAGNPSEGSSTDSPKDPSDFSFCFRRNSERFYNLKSLDVWLLSSWMLRCKELNEVSSGTILAHAWPRMILNTCRWTNSRAVGENLLGFVSLLIWCAETFVCQMGTFSRTWPLQILSVRPRCIRGASRVHDVLWNGQVQEWHTLSKYMVMSAYGGRSNQP